MSPMNVLSIDSIQATDKSTVSSNSSLGPWNDSSSKFSDLINQHQQAARGKSNPKSGNKNDSSVASTTGSRQSITETDESLNHENIESEAIDAQRAEHDIEAQDNDNLVTEKESQTTESKDKVNADTASNTLDKSATTQENIKNTEQAEHLKLLAMLEASEGISTDHTPTDDKRMSTTEESKLAKMLAQMSTLSEKELAKLKEKFSGDTSSEEIKQLDTAIKYESKASKEAKNKSISISPQVTDFEGELVETMEQSTLSAKSGKNKEDLNGQNIVSLSSKNLSKEGELAGHAKITDTRSIESNVESIDESSDLATSEANDNKTSQQAKVLSDKGLDINTDKKNEKVSANNQNEKVVIESKKNNEGLDFASTEVEQSAVSAKGVEVIKDFSTNSYQTKDSSNLSERVNITQQLGQNNNNNSDTNNQKNGHSDQGKPNSETKTINIADAETLEMTESEDKLDLNMDKRIQQEAVVSDNKHAISAFSSKETSVFKPIEINPHNNIHSTSFVQAEAQAASQVIEKAASDAIDAMTQKKTLNLHNEAISIYRKDFSAAVKDKVMVMISQKLQQVEIRLDPPELGSMHVKVNLQNEQAAVSFIVQNQQAKDALDQNMGKLRDMLAQNGVDVGDANVEQQQQQTSSESGNSGQGRHFDDGNSGELESQQALVANANLYKASATGVDYYA
ncbi:flagellar hook-length control protein FliK [Thalassotalea profundi]|uniref:Flagellar hook-length control protein-like C-terminal domain-containing protein n=1 Tax=Thalassotalea profundi TaxID=2036687 RepID=A0ABQ3II34_9GAMM|nr:flagellar hook-length control protein FliK [Thalassotalea profundi]GHE80844.1 hypothetical protein GCM10011501_06080 [Thalassotalea profundi]